MSEKTVVFDLDGTLADTSADLIEAANRSFRKLGLGDALDPVADAATAFHGGRAMLRLGFSRVGEAPGGAAVERAYRDFLNSYAEGIVHKTRMYPGAMRAVEALKAAGWRVAICTNKPEALAETLLVRLGARAPFHALVGADTLPTRKPDPAPYRAAVERAGGTVARSFLVGDTVTDRDTARAAGVPVVLVTFGPGGAGVAGLEPDALLHAFGDLPALAPTLIG